MLGFDPGTLGLLDRRYNHSATEVFVPNQLTYYKLYFSYLQLSLFIPKGPSGNLFYIFDAFLPQLHPHQQQAFHQNHLLANHPMQQLGVPRREGCDIINGYSVLK